MTPPHTPTPMENAAPVPIVCDAPAENEALTLLHQQQQDAARLLAQAKAEYESARGQDWRRSVVPPNMVLEPLLRRVKDAEARCRTLGLMENR